MEGRTRWVPDGCPFSHLSYSWLKIQWCFLWRCSCSKYHSRWEGSSRSGRRARFDQSNRRRDCRTWDMSASRCRPRPRFGYKSGRNHGYIQKERQPSSVTWRVRPELETFWPRASMVSLSMTTMPPQRPCYWCWYYQHRKSLGSKGHIGGFCSSKSRHSRRRM